MKALWVIFWGAIVALFAGLVYTYRKELGLVPETKKLSESMVFTAQNSAIFVDELQKIQNKINELQESKTGIQLIKVSVLPDSISGEPKIYLVKNSGNTELYFFDGTTLNEILLV